MADPISDASAIDKDISTPAIVDNINDKTPDPVVPDKVDDLPEPPRPDREGMTQAGDTTGELGKRIEQVENLLEKLTQAVTQKTDEAAGKVEESLPWTHRLGRRHND